MRLAVLALISLLAIVRVADDGYSAGACGGVMRGYDGRGYPCAADRKPVCETATGRCVCLLKKECGARRSQNWYDQ